MRLGITLYLCLLFTPLVTFAENGPLTSAEALNRFVLPAGLHIELVAAEPLVVDPVAISFDAAGRMYVAEYRDYPSGPPNGAAPLSRIKLLEDTNGDGRMDQATVFADQLSFAQGVMAYRDGVLVTAAPHVFFLRDTNGDGKSDQQIDFFQGFRPGNPQLRVSHPQRGIDNWIYLANGLSDGEITAQQTAQPLKLQRRDFRFDPRTMQFEGVTGLGQFGNTFDDWGNRFYCSNRNPVMTSLLPQSALQANPFLQLSKGYEDVAPSGAEAKVYPLTQLKGRTTAFSHAGTHTAACGVWVHRGTGLGSDTQSQAYQGNVFVCEPTGSLVARNLLKPNGVSFQATKAQAKQEFLASTDPWFRPVSLADGPDGCLYVVDMYREVIEHPQWMPEGLAETLNLRAGDDRGRIYRIRATDQPLAKHIPPVSPKDYPRLLCAKNGWQRDLGQRLIVEESRTELTPELQKILSDEQQPTRTRLHALWSLEGLQRLRTESLIPLATKASSPHLREHSVRILAHRHDEANVVPTLIAATRDEQIRVRFQAVLALATAESPAVETALANTIARDADDPWMQQAILCGVSTRSAAILARLLSAPDFPQTDSPTRTQVLRQLAEVVGSRGDVQELATVARLISDETSNQQWWRFALLAGMAEGLQRHRGALGRTSLAKLLDNPPKKLQALAPKIKDYFEQANQRLVDAGTPLADRVAAAQLLVHQSPSQTADLVNRILAQQPAEDLQTASIEALAVCESQTAVDLLLRHWKTLNPEPQQAAIRSLLSRSTTSSLLLTAMKEKALPATVVALDQRERLLRSRNPQIQELSQRLFGAEVSANRQQVVQQYLPAFDESAEAHRGFLVFKRVCAACHRIGEVGHVVGPSISDVRNRTKASLLYDILDPNRAVEPRYASYTIITRNGKVVTGLFQGETESGVTLLQAAGKSVTVPRADIDEIEASNRSLMPEGIEKDISPQAMADLVEYLKQQK